MMELLPIKRALLSVTDKSGLVDLACFLAGAGVELTSTGGTRKVLLDAGLKVTSVSEVTGFPEMLDGRVKTLHPRIHGGILADKDNPAHTEALARAEIRPYDMIVVNLYDFAGALAKNLDEAATVEQIDIGGPCLLRAAAKNFASVLVLPDPEYYPLVIKELAENNMRAPLDLRRQMARRAFESTARYDGLVASWFAKL